MRAQNTLPVNLMQLSYNSREPVSGFKSKLRRLSAKSDFLNSMAYELQYDTQAEFNQAWANHLALQMQDAEKRHKYHEAESRERELSQFRMMLAGYGAIANAVNEDINELGKLSKKPVAEFYEALSEQRGLLEEIFFNAFMCPENLFYLKLPASDINNLKELFNFMLVHTSNFRSEDLDLSDKTRATYELVTKYRPTIIWLSHLTDCQVVIE